MREPLPLRLGPDAARRSSRLAGEVRVGDSVLRRLAGSCSEVSTEEADLVAAARDWWPLSLLWAARGLLPAKPSALARPAEAAEVAAVLRICSEEVVPVTPAAGRSGVCGGAVPAFGGVALDLTRLSGLLEVDDPSLLVSVRAGTFGEQLEEQLQRDHGLTLGHWPQSIGISTVGGWLACRSAGQYSTRYGKVEDMAAGLEVALADGTLLRTGSGAPRAAAGPDLTQLFVGSEGTLGVITAATLRARPAPPAQGLNAYGFRSFARGLEACRRILRRGATPAVLRLYDETESQRLFEAPGRCLLVVVDEADPALLEATLAVVSEECAEAEDLGGAPAERWLAERNSIPSLGSLVEAGLVLDTVEVAASWAALPGLYDSAVAGLRALEGTLAASAHQSHSYGDGGCLYFTFAGQPEPELAEEYYRRAWDEIMAATVEAGGAISHHHGIGLNRARYLPGYLGASFGVLSAVKAALDPAGVLNPGKLGLPSPFGEVAWP